MGVLASPEVNWGSSPAPHSAAELVEASSIVVITVQVSATVLPSPASNQLLAEDTGVGYAG